MIISFKDKHTENLYKGYFEKKYPAKILETARRKLRHIEAATSLNDLKVPPGNQLKKLKVERAGKYSIRINKKWRICFRWKNNNAYEVEITDYH